MGPDCVTAGGPLPSRTAGLWKEQNYNQWLSTQKERVGTRTQQEDRAAGVQADYV